VYHCINSTDPVRIAGHVPDLRSIGQVRDEAVRSTIHHVLHRRHPMVGTGVHHNLVSLAEQRFRRSQAEPISRPGNQNPRHFCLPRSQMMPSCGPAGVSRL
jgi:hypothetical protein